MKTFFITGIFLSLWSFFVQAQSPSGRPAIRSQDSTGRDTAISPWRVTAKPTNEGLPVASPKFIRNELKGVTVTARKPLVERHADRTIINVQSLISNAGSNTLDVLSNTPGLEVDEEGAITLHGRSGAAIWIDGRPSRLSGTDLANYLRSLPAGVLDRIEIMTTPPAGYEAAGTGGIINIITKKNKSKGLAGNITGNIATGVYGRSANSLHMDYGTNKLSLTGNAGYSILNNFFLSDRLRSYYNPDGSYRSALRQHYLESSNTVAYTAMLRMDYHLPHSATLGIELNGSSSPYDEKGDYRSYYLNAHDQPDSNMFVISRLRNTWKTASADLQYRYPFGNAAFTAALNYYTQQTDRRQTLLTSMYTPDNALKGSDTFPVRQPFEVKAWTINAGYSFPLPGNMKAETGLQANYSRGNSQTAIASAGSSSPDSTYGEFTYTEQVQAAFATLRKEWKYFSLQTGLRAERTNASGTALNPSAGQDSSFSRAYINLFPTAYLSFKTDSQLTHQLFLSLGKRINRPWYQEMNPFPFFFDKSTIYTGNPLLRPELSYTAELSHVYRQNLTTTLQYSDTRDMILQTFRQERDRFIAIPFNISRVIQLNMNIGASTLLTKWWTCVAYVEFNNYACRLGQNPPPGAGINSNARFWRLSLNNQLKLDKTWSAEISGFYRSRLVSVQSIIQPQWYINTAIRKKLLDEKLILSLSLRDVFYTRIQKRDINTLIGQTVSLVNTQDTRIVSLSISYLFGKSGKPSQERSDRKAEINRLKNSN